MSKAPTDWMPLNVGEYLADTMDLSADQHGAYLLLIMHYWKNRGPIKNEKSLQNVSKISWKKTQEILQRFFKKNGEEWHHGRIDDELNKALHNQKKKQNQTGPARAAKAQKTDTVTEPVTGLRAGTPLPLPLPNRIDSSSPPTLEGAAGGAGSGEDSAVAYIRAFDAAGAAVWGEALWGAHRPWPGQGDFAYAKRLEKLGSTPAEFQTYCEFAMRAIQGTTGKAPRGPGYFEKGFAEHLTGSSMGQAATQQSAEQVVEAAAIDAAMDEIRKQNPNRSVPA